MICPICEGKCKVLDKRTSVFKISTRQYECLECLTRFKTKEKIEFESLPFYIRKRFLETGKMK